MPKDNNQTQNPQNNTAPVADDMPPIMMEDTHPPMINEGEQATVINDQPLSTATPPTTDSGSAAPADDIVMPSVVTSGPNVKSPTKKFGGGKVIATILGLFLLVGGVGAGVMLTQQNQDVREKASTTQGCGQYGSASACNSSCGSPKSDGKTYACRWSSELGECKESGNPCGTTDTTSKPERVGCNTCTGGTDGQYSCEGVNYAYCGGCVNTCVRGDLLANGGCEAYVSANCNTGGIGSCSAIIGPVNIYYCEGGVSGANVGCNDNDPLPNGVNWDPINKRIVGSFCGTVQVDEIDTAPLRFCSRNDTSGCDTSTTPPATTPPAISAVCQDVKAYSETWTLLTNAQLSQLKAGNKVNFCVTGSASSGSFNKARFTINNVLQAETTTVRPSGTDFCQTYTIPAATTTFAVSAQINHVTLGWK